MQKVFDGHNDVLFRLWRRQREGFDPEPQPGGRPEKKQRRDLQRMRGY